MVLFGKENEGVLETEENVLYLNFGGLYVQSLSVYVLTIVLNKKYNLKFQNKMKNEIKTGNFLMEFSSQDLLNPGLVFEKVINIFLSLFWHYLFSFLP